MIVEVVLPQAGMAMTDGEVVAWRKAVGDQVAAGEILVEVEAAKAVVEVEAPASGVLSKIVAEVGTVVPVQGILAVIERTQGDEAAPVTPLDPGLAAPPAGSGSSGSVAPDCPAGRPSAPADGRAITPAARRAARELGLDLGRVVGTGPNGRVVEADVRRTADAATARKAQASEPTIGAFVAAPEQPHSSAAWLSAGALISAASEIRLDDAREWDERGVDLFVRAACLAIGDAPALRVALGDETGAVAISVAASGASAYLPDALGLSLAGIASTRQRNDPDRAATVSIAWLGETELDRIAIPPRNGQLLSLAIGRARELLRRDGQAMTWTRVVSVSIVADAGSIALADIAELSAGIARRLARIGSIVDA